MDCVLSLLVSWHCTIVINDNYWRLPPLLLCSLLIPLTLEMISIRLSVAIENRKRKMLNIRAVHKSLIIDQAKTKQITTVKEI